jgi:hypothetical protein
MRLTMLRGSCVGGDCPTVYATDRGTLVVQGATVTDAEGVSVPAGETLVEVPADLLLGLAGRATVVLPTGDGNR